LTSSTARRSRRCKRRKLREKLAALGLDPMVMTPGEFDAHVRKEIALNAALVKAAGLKPD
jgi:tripartite-type tricarboxylate transporter receptor subunit TctC